jgi:frataxin-like iron-binding protein CyaY
MHFLRIFPLAAILVSSLPWLSAQAQQPASPPLPAIPQLMHEVEEHQKALEKVVENYTYNSLQTTQDIDANGQVKKIETKEREVFFVHGRQIGRLVKKDGKPLDDQDQQKETERVTKQVEKAEKPESEKPKKDQDLNVSRILEIMDVRNPRRENYRGRPTILFDVMGRKDAITHNLGEEAFKKFQGTVWIDEADRQIAHIDVTFRDNFHVAGGLVLNIEKGSRISFDQAPVNGEIWLPSATEGTLQARVLLVKGFRQHYVERDYDYKRFHAEAQQGKDAKAVVENKP